MAILLCMPLTVSLAPQKPDPEKWHAVERMCGKVEWLDRFPVKGSTSSFDEKRRPVKKAEVRLYSREKDVPCCGTGSPIAQTMTNGSGMFKLAYDKPGNYWVVINAAGMQYSHEISYADDPKIKEQVSCSDLLYDLTDRGLELGRVITVD